MLKSDPLPSLRDATRFGSLQAAHDALPASGGTIVLRNSTYTQNSGTLNITKPVTLLAANARSGCLIRKTSGTHDLITVGTGGSLTVEGVGFDCNYPTLTSGNAISFGSTSAAVSGLVVRRCHFANISGTAISLTRASYVWIENNTFDTLYRSGVRLNSPGSGNSNDHIWIRDNHIKHAQQVAPTAGFAAIQSAGTTGHTNEFVWIERNRIEVSGQVGIGLDWIQRAWVTDNDIEGNGTRGEGIAFTGSYVTIRGNRSYGNSAAAGILLWAMTTEPNGNQHNRIVDNECWDNVQGIAIVWGNEGADIKNLTVTGNRCYDAGSGTQLYGIQSYLGSGVTTGTWSRTDISNNDLRDNVTGPMNIVSATSIGRYLNRTVLSDGTSILQNDDATSRVTVMRGTSGTTSTEVMLHARHRDSADTVTGSLARIVAGYDTNQDRKLAGFQAKKATAFANRVDLELLASKDGNTSGVTVVGKGISSTTDGVSGFGPADSAWNGPHLIMGSSHLWIDATGALRIKSSAPTSDTDGTVVGTQT